MIGCQTSACLVALDTLVRAPLEHRIHCFVDVGARMSSLIENNVFGTERLDTLF